MTSSNPTPFGRILLIDDNVDSCELLQLLLTHHGYAVEIADSGEHGLVVAKAFLPQVVFLDLGMPGMSGYEVAEAIRGDEQLANVFLLALTGWNDQSTRAAVIDAGFDRHLVKPPQISHITGVLDEFFGSTPH